MTTASQPVSKILLVSGLTVHYLEWGEVHAPAIVCVHGYTSSAEAFNAVARHLHHQYRVIAADVRGHGESGWAPDGAYQYSDQVDDLAAFVDNLQLPRFILIGTSMGGIIAMAYAVGHPNRLLGLVINDIGPDVEAGSQRITGISGSRPDEFASPEDAMAYGRQISPGFASRGAEDQREVALGLLRQNEDGRWVWKMDPAYIRQRVERGALVRPALWPELRKVSCPTLVVWGAASDVLSEVQARRMVEALPHGELVAVPGAGHAPTLVEPVVSEALDRFLSRLR
jgi:pimeloyl-ACP methyl ester carboxylesterase